MLKPDTGAENHIIEIGNEHINRILEIGAECNLETWSVVGLQQEIERQDSIRLAFLRDGIIIGFLLARIVCEFEIELLNLGILKSYRRQGIGAGLLVRMLTGGSENQVQTIWLEVRESNKNAIEFYKNKGFTRVQVRKNFYAAPPESAILMKLTLTKPACQFLLKTLTET